ncbi:type II toxin-antitoxin system RelE/ParE family toxin [Sphingomonas qilianensis]|uniref:Type II toxin-antitoxin system RelE/ParE family toxin n=1 Tax=Sphingomonas qilianensis TaxID=1736690 RepID=A0ABU9XQF3_9SPHN
MLDIEWSGPALGDLRRINSWLEENAAPEYAVRLLAAIRYRAEWLRDFPRGGRPFRGDMRVLRVYQTPYLIRYRVVEALQKVYVLRVHHEREDWSIEP